LLTRRLKDLAAALFYASDFQYVSNHVTAQFAIDSNATAESAVVLVRSGNDVATLTGALKVHPPRRLRDRADRFVVATLLA
jgi:hypothetical protein